MSILSGYVGRIVLAGIAALVLLGGDAAARDYGKFTGITTEGMFKREDGTDVRNYITFTLNTWDGDVKACVVAGRECTSTGPMTTGSTPRYEPIPSFQ